MSKSLFLFRLFVILKIFLNIGCGFSSGGTEKSELSDSSPAGLSAESNATAASEEGNAASGSAGGTSQVVLDGSANYLKVDLARAGDSISLNESTSCAINLIGKLYCWGLNSNGSIGLGNLAFVNKPTIVDGNESYSKVRIGKQFGCALTKSGKLKCFGDNTYGQAGNGGNLPQTTPFSIDNGTTYSDISASSFVACGITTSGILKCWGYNTYGAVGVAAYDTNYQEPKVAIPTRVPIAPTVRMVATDITHSCAITTDNDLFCWGINRYIGVNQSTGVSGLPVQIDVGTKYLDVVVGNSATCGITVAHKLRCWGDGSSNGAGTSLVLAPQTIDSAIFYQKISMGDSSVCGITTGQITKCWGLNDHGQAGVNSSALNISVPTTLSTQNSLSDVKIYNRHACGLDLQGKIMCWGINNYGQAGTDGSAEYYSVPTYAGTNIVFSSIYVHYSHSCGIRTSNGAVYCWGNNSVAQVGVGNTIEIASIPMPLSY